MATPTVNLPTLTVSTNASGVSPGLGTVLDYSVAISILAPATLTTTSGGAVQVEPTDTGANWVTLLSGGNTVFVPQASAIVINPFPFRQIRLSSSATETAPRTFQLLATIPV